MSSSLAEKHSFGNELKFHFKSFLLRGKRRFQNTFLPVKKFVKSEKLSEYPVIGFSESELWNKEDNDQNRILTAGKIENLRVAGKKLDSIEVKAGEIFSFWKHIGNPNFGKGYVVGREIREGCIVPTIAGGLCQLSNALYDAALKAGFEILERHKHTWVIKGSLAEKDRDATVKWNYIDLRFRSKNAFKIEVKLTATHLVVQLRGIVNTKNEVLLDETRQNEKVSSVTNDCYSCGNVSCFKHPGTTPVMQQKRVTVFILDEKWPEYDEYISSLVTDQDIFILPLKNNRFVKTHRYQWKSAVGKKNKYVGFPALKRALKLRWAGSKNVFKLSVKADAALAKKAGRMIPLEATHLVVSQNLLPFLWEEGAMGGRTFEVLMTRLPLHYLHARLDAAHQKHTKSSTLNDYRAHQKLVKAESMALNQAMKIITPHTEIMTLFKNKSVWLEWKKPEGVNRSNGKRILFPASGLGRKGAYEMRAVAQNLGLELVILEKKQEHKNFWTGVKTSGFTNLEEIGLVVYPAWVEQQPRLLLKALAKGIPVIATKACGLPAQENLFLVDTGNDWGLKEAVEKQLKRMNDVYIRDEKIKMA